VSKTSSAKADAQRDDLQRRADDKAHDARAKVVSSTENAKDKIGDRLDDINEDQRRQRDNLRQVH
jgi:uncharacterized protein YjbJ (UPF0337 family)